MLEPTPVFVEDEMLVESENELPPELIVELDTELDSNVDVGGGGTGAPEVIVVDEDDEKPDPLVLTLLELMKTSLALAFA